MFPYVYRYLFQRIATRLMLLLLFVSLNMELCSDPVATISLPYPNSLVRANVPVFGVAYAKKFKSYRLEFGKGLEPEKWTIINSSTKPEPVDPWVARKVKWNPDWGAFGNLGTLETGLSGFPHRHDWKHSLVGIHTIRLIVEDTLGEMAEARVVVDVSHVITNQLGGTAKSEDGMVEVEIPSDSIATAFLLVSIRKSNQISGPKGLIGIGNIYEWRPPDVSFSQPSSLVFRYDPQKILDSYPSPLEGDPTALFDEEEEDIEKEIDYDELGIYSYDMVRKKWRRQSTVVDPKSRTARTSLGHIAKYRGYFGLFVDQQRPPAPRVIPVPQVVQSGSLQIQGFAEEQSEVVVSIQDREFRCTANDEGRFETYVDLREGINTVRVRCKDGVGHESPICQAIVDLRYLHPPKVRRLLIVGPSEVRRGDHILIRLDGEDASPSTIDSTLIQIASSKTDPAGFNVELLETDANSGTYVATVQLGMKSDYSTLQLGVVLDGEEVVARTVDNSNFQVSRVYRDRVGPSAPSITCTTEPRSRWDTFEPVGLSLWDQWGSSDIKFGGYSEVEVENSNHFLRIRPLETKRGHFGVTLNHSYAVDKYPIVSFDYRIDPRIEIDFTFDLEHPSPGTRAIRLTDKKSFYAQLATFEGTSACGKWHHAEINLLEVLKARYFPLKTFTVKAMGFIDLDGGDRLYVTRYPGKSARAGRRYDIDNFAVMRYHKEREVTFTWTVEDESGISEFSYILDQISETIPDEVAEGTKASSTYSQLKDGRWWFHVRARDKVGNWGPANHYLLVVDLDPPIAVAPENDGQWSFSVPITMSLSDIASGIDVSSVVLKIDDQQFSGRDEALEYNQANQSLTFFPDRVKPYSPLYGDGQKVAFHLQASDRAGHPLNEPLEFVLHVESPLVIRPLAPRRPNGWYDDFPEIRLKESARNDWTLEMEVPTLRDAQVPYAETLALTRRVFLKNRDDSNRIYVRTVNAGRYKVQTQAVFQGEKESEQSWKAPLRIGLEHRAFVLAGGGLLGRYFRNPDFTDECLVRVDPFIHLWDERQRSTPMVLGAQSARWEGALEVKEPGMLDLELAVWHGTPAKATLWVDGEVFLDFPPKKNEQGAYVRKKALFAKGLHSLKLELSDSLHKEWSLMLLRWRRGEQGEAIREVIGSDVLYHPKNLATTWFTLNDQPSQEYRVPFLVPPGTHTLRFHSEGEAGQKEEEKVIHITVTGEMTADGPAESEPNP